MFVLIFPATIADLLQFALYMFQPQRSGTLPSV